MTSRIWMLGSGKMGHEANCNGIIAALGLQAETRPVRPRKIFDLLAPWGPIDWKDRPDQAGSCLAPPFPDIAIAAGRVTVPYLRYLKSASKGRTFTIFMQDPRTGTGAADVIWVPAHDRLRGENVIVTLTSPHPLRPKVLASSRANPDPRLSRLKGQRLAMILGGPSGDYEFGPQDHQALANIAASCLHKGYALMVTPSRRTPPDCLSVIRQSLAAAGATQETCFIWDGEGDNPYIPMLAMAEVIIVTGDSVNMVGEACASGRPVHVYQPSGGHSKTFGFVEALIKAGYVRPWRGEIENWTYEPLDSTGLIAARIAEFYRAHQERIQTQIRTGA